MNYPDKRSKTFIALALLAPLFLLSAFSFGLPPGDHAIYPDEVRSPIENWSGDADLYKRADTLCELWEDRRKNPEKLEAYARHLKEYLIENRINNIYYAIEALRVSADRKAYRFWTMMPNGEYSSPHVARAGLFYASLYHYDAHGAKNPIQRVSRNVLGWVERCDGERANYEYHRYYLRREGIARPDLLFRMSRQSAPRAIGVFLNDFKKPLDLGQAEIQKIARWVRDIDDARWAQRYRFIDSSATDKAKAALRELGTYKKNGDRWWVRMFALHMMASDRFDLGDLDLLDKLQHDPYPKLRKEARLLNDMIRSPNDHTDDTPARPWENEPTDGESEGTPR